MTAKVQAKDQLVLENAGQPDTGLDPGLEHLLTDAQGNRYNPPRALKDNLSRLRREQKKLSRKFEARKQQHEYAKWLAKKEGRQARSIKDVEYSNRLKRQIVKVARIHTKVANVREYWHKKNAAVIADRYNRVACEEHSVQFMIRNRRQAQVVTDRAIHAQKLALKSTLGDRYIPTPNQRPGIGGNSQTCLCEASVPKALKDRTHHCPECGLVADRDQASANIVQLIGTGTTTLATGSGQDFVKRGEGDPQDQRKRSEKGKRHPTKNKLLKNPPAGQQPVVWPRPGRIA